MRVSLFAAGLLLVLSLIDATFTGINIQHYGLDVEWNPIMRFLIEHYGIWIMFAMKSFAGVFLIFLLCRTTEQKVAKWVTPILFWMVGAYSVIVFYGYCLLAV